MAGAWSDKRWCTSPSPYRLHLHHSFPTTFFLTLYTEKRSQLFARPRLERRRQWRWRWEFAGERVFRPPEKKRTTNKGRQRCLELLYWAWLGVDSVNNRVQLGYGLGIFVLYGILYSLVKVDNWGPKFYLD